MLDINKICQRYHYSLQDVSNATNLPLHYLQEVAKGDKELSVKAIDRIMSMIKNHDIPQENLQETQKDHGSNMAHEKQENDTEAPPAHLSMEGLGDKIRALREEKGASLDEMSRKLGLSLSYLSEVERGKRVPSLQSLQNICRYFNVPVSLLITTPSRMRVTGEKIRRNREAKKITQKQLAKMASLSPGLIAQLEAGKVQPSLKTIESIANSLEISVCYLILEQEDVEGIIAAVSPELRELLYDPKVQMIIGNICMMDQQEIKLILDFVHMLKNRQV